MGNPALISLRNSIPKICLANPELSEGSLAHLKQRHPRVRTQEAEVEPNLDTQTTSLGNDLGLGLLPFNSRGVLNGHTGSVYLTCVVGQGLPLQAHTGVSTLQWQDGIVKQPGRSQRRCSGDCLVSAIVARALLQARQRALVQFRV